MKTNYFYITFLMLVVLTFGGCGKSEPTDLRLLELKGNVKTVTTYLTTNVNSKGKRTRQSFRHQGETYEFDVKGVLSTISDSYNSITFSRDKKGNIVSIMIPCEKEDGRWNDSGYTKTYIWDKNGFPVSVEYENCLGGYYNRKFVYNDSTIVGTVQQNCDEGIEWEVTRTYKVLNTDSQGNWTKRIVVESNSENSDMEFSLEERTITYYENNMTSPSYGSKSYDTQSYNSKQYDDSSTKWKEFAGTTYRASQFTSEGYQYYAFSYDRTGKGKYIIWWNYLGTNVVEDQMEFSIYKVESEGNYLYLYSYELNTPVKIQIQGSSLYSMTGDRYEIWN